MKFNLPTLIKTIILCQLTCACLDGLEKATDNQELIGNEPSVFSGGFSRGAMVDENSSVMVDEYSNRIHIISNKPFQLKDSLLNPFPGQNVSIVTDDELKFIVVSSQSDFAIVKSDGSSNRNPAEIFSDIAAMGYSASKNLLLIEDINHEITVLKLKDNGDVLDTWLAGPFIDGAHSIDIATFSSNSGDLFAVLTDGSSVKIDLVQSFAEKKWIYNVLTNLQNPDAQQSLQWLALTEDEKNLLVATSNQILSVSALSGQIVDSISLQEKNILSHSSKGTPHVSVYAQSEINSIAVVYIDSNGKLVEKSILARTGMFEESILDIKHDRLILTFVNINEPVYTYYPEEYSILPDQRPKPESRDFAKRTIERVRLSDGRNLDRTVIDDSSRLICGSADIIVQHKSLLGKLEKRKYGKTPKSEMLTSFNLDFLREK